MPGRTLKYLVSGNREGIRERIGPVTVTAALRTARHLVQEGYIDVRIGTPRGQILSSDDLSHLKKLKDTAMVKDQRRGNREAKKPKKEKIKVIAAAPSQKTSWH